MTMVITMAMAMVMTMTIIKLILTITLMLSSIVMVDSKTLMTNIMIKMMIMTMTMTRLMTITMMLSGIVEAYSILTFKTWRGSPSKDIGRLEPIAEGADHHNFDYYNILDLISFVCTSFAQYLRLNITYWQVYNWTHKSWFPLKMEKRNMRKNLCQVKIECNNEIFWLKRGIFV